MKVVYSPTLIHRWLNEDMKSIKEIFKGKKRGELTEDERLDLLAYLEQIDISVSRLRETIENF